MHSDAFNAGDASASAAPTDIKSRVIALAGNPSKNFFDLASALVSLHDFEASLLSEVAREAGISRRRIYYLLKVGRMSLENAISRNDAEKLGWTKLQIIARHIAEVGTVTREDVHAFMAIAHKSTARELPQKLRSGITATTRAEVFYLNASQRDELRRVLVAFGAKRRGVGLVGREDAILQIVRAAMQVR